MNCLSDTCNALTEGLVQLGVALHPAQDKEGHIDYYARKITLLTFIDGALSEAWDAGTYADDVTNTYSINGVKYYHFDDVIRSRNETYNILGRFRIGYKEVFG